MRYKKATKPTAITAMVILAMSAAILLTNLQASPGDREDKGAVLPTDARTVMIPPKGEEYDMGLPVGEMTEGGGSSIIFSYNGKKYDLTEKDVGINAITDCREVGQYIIVKGHIGPHHGYYGIFNTLTEEFEKDIFGAHLTYEEGIGKEEVELSDFIYCFWNEIYDGNGTLLASFQLGETEEIRNLGVEDGTVYVDIMDIEIGDVAHRVEIILD